MNTVAIDATANGGNVSSGAHWIAKASLHGHVQGTFSAMTGGDYITTFVTSAVSSSTGSLLEPLKNESLLGYILFNSTIGGVTEEIMGGDFWQGFTTAAMITGLNHCGDMLNEVYSQNKKEKIRLSEEKDKIAIIKGVLEDIRSGKIKEGTSLDDLFERDGKSWGYVNMYVHGQEKDGVKITISLTFDDSTGGITDEMCYEHDGVIKIKQHKSYKIKFNNWSPELVTTTTNSYYLVYNAYNFTHTSGSGGNASVAYIRIIFFSNNKNNLNSFKRKVSLP